MSEEHFILRHSKILAIIGIVLNILLIFVMVGIVSSHPISNIISFLILYGLLFWLGLYLILISMKYKMIVKDKEITMFPVFAKPYVFLFDDIVSVVRKEQHNRYGVLEEILIKTKEGKKMKVQSIQVSYERLLRKIESYVNKERLVGFEKREEKDRSLINFRIIELIKLFASTPELQLSLFPDKIEEIVYTFDSWLLIYENDTVSRYRYFNNNEYRLISDLNKLLNSFDDEQLTESAIRTSEKWSEVRLRARDILEEYQRRLEDLDLEQE